MVVLAKALDYSQARPDLAQVKAAGYESVYRYVCSDTAENGMPGKRLTPKERDAILHAGLDIGIHGEDESGAVLKGYNRGLAQGAQWTSYARNVLGAPQGMTIVAAVDTDTGGYTSTVDQYLRGVQDGLGGYYKLGVYGSYNVIVGAHNVGLGNSCYVMTNAWGSDFPPTIAHMHQYGGDNRFQGVDYNDVLRIPHGTWLQVLGGDNSMSAEDVQALKTYIDAKFTALMKGDTDANGNSLPANTNTHPVNLSFADRRQRDILAAVMALPDPVVPPTPATPEEIAAVVVPAVLAALPASVAGGITKTEVAAAIAAASAVLGA